MCADLSASGASIGNRLAVSRNCRQQTEPTDSAETAAAEPAASGAGARSRRRRRSRTPLCCITGWSRWGRCCRRSLAANDATDADHSHRRAGRRAGGRSVRSRGVCQRVAAGRVRSRSEGALGRGADLHDRLLHHRALVCSLLSIAFCFPFCYFLSLTFHFILFYFISLFRHFILLHLLLHF